MRLHTAAPEALTADTIQRATQLDAGTISRCLADLVTAGVAKPTEASDTFRLAPATPAKQREVDALAVMYNERPVTLVRMVYEQGPASVRSFADAFRLRDEDTNR